MKKIIAVAVATAASASAAFAGNLAYIAPEATMIEDSDMAGAMGGSGSWLIPLIIIAVLALALTSSEDEDVPDVMVRR